MLREVILTSLFSGVFLFGSTPHDDDESPFFTYLIRLTFKSD